MAPITPRVAVSSLFALDGAVLGGWVAHLPDVQRSLRLGSGALGFVLLASSLGSVLAIVPFSGRLIHRFGSRRVSVVAACLVLTVIPLLVQARSTGVLTATLFVMGAANGTLDVAMNAHSIAVQDRLERPILSAVHGWFCIGGFLGGAGAALANLLRVSPRDHLAVASLVLAALLILLVPGLLANDADRGEEGARFILPHGRLLAIGLLCLLSFFAEGAVWDWSALYLRNELHTSAAIAALGFGVGAGAMAMGRLFGDRFVGRWGAAKALRGSGLLASGGILLAMALPLVPVAFLGFAAAGVGLANAVPILFAAAARVPGVSPSAGLAAVASLGYAAFLGGPPLVGNVAQFTSLRFGLALVAILALPIAFGSRALGPAEGKSR